MASITNSAVQITAGPCFARQTKVGNGFSGLKSAAFSIQKNFPSVRLQSGSSRLRVSCAAKAETLEKVCAIVKKQLALSDTTTVTGASSFTEDLGADSLDTVEVVMGLEEAFDISVEEDNAQSIKTVQDAADLIEKLIAARS